MLFLRKIHVKRFKQWENQATIPHIQNNYTREKQWFCSVQTLAQTRTSQKSRACLKERQKQINHSRPLKQWFSNTTGHNAHNPNVRAPLPFCPDFFCPGQSSRSVPRKGKPKVCMLISISLCSPLYQTKLRKESEGRKDLFTRLAHWCSGCELTAVFTGAQLSPPS